MHEPTPATVSDASSSIQQPAINSSQSASSVRSRGHLAHARMFTETGGSQVCLRVRRQWLLFLAPRGSSHRARLVLCAGHKGYAGADWLAIVLLLVGRARWSPVVCLPGLGGAGEPEGCSCCWWRCCWWCGRRWLGGLRHRWTAYSIAMMVRWRLARLARLGSVRLGVAEPQQGADLRLEASPRVPHSKCSAALARAQ